jgi:lipid-binding SYLF domain-containing protein
MSHRKTNLGLTAAVLTLGLTLSGQAIAKFTAEDAAELDAEAKATLAKFVADTKGAEAVFADAKGVLVCPKIRKGGFGVNAVNLSRSLVSRMESRLELSGLVAGKAAIGSDGIDSTR